MAFDLNQTLKTLRGGFQGTRVGQLRREDAARQEAESQKRQLFATEMEKRKMAVAKQKEDMQISEFGNDWMIMQPLLEDYKTTGNRDSLARAQQHWTQRVGKLEEEGRDSQYSQMVGQALGAAQMSPDPDQAVDMALKAGEMVQEQLYDRKIWERPDDKSMAKIKAKLAILHPDGDVTSEQYQKDQRALLGAPKLNPDDPDKSKVREEVRKRLNDDRDRILKSVGEIEEQYTKLGDLNKEIDKGNRYAVAQALVALVKLGDPTSVVKEAEMWAALNKPTASGAVVQYLKDSASDSKDPQSAMRTAELIGERFDILSPDAVSTQQLKDVADALIGGRIPSIQNDFATSRERGEQVLSDVGFKSIFTPKYESTVMNRMDELLGRDTRTRTAAPAPGTPPPDPLGIR